MIFTLQAYGKILECVIGGELSKRQGVLFLTLTLALLATVRADDPPPHPMFFGDSVKTTARSAAKFGIAYRETFLHIF